jgi:homoserine O-succinyltransferase/O-acetyltransferase
MALVPEGTKPVGRRLRVGIINIMPRAETYEANLTRPLARAPLAVEPVWIRLGSHVYSSSNVRHIARRYVTFEQATSTLPLDGLILTGAPVEELPFEEVHYWPELVAILQQARRTIPSTLGLCWGGLALAKQLEIDKQIFPKKLFGVYRNRTLNPEAGVLGDSDELFWCAHSRHSGIRDDVLERAFRSSDHRYLMHLGHPEYDAQRLAFEWARDRSLGRTDVEPPRNFDPASPKAVWLSHCETLFSRWLASLRQAPRAGGLPAAEAVGGDRQIM